MNGIDASSSPRLVEGIITCRRVTSLSAEPKGNLVVALRDKQIHLGATSSDAQLLALVVRERPLIQV